MLKMQSMKNIITTSRECEDTANEQTLPTEIINFVSKKVELLNAEHGNLKKFDGIDCPLCNNKGIIYTAIKDSPVPIIKNCTCVAKRNAIRYLKQSGLENLLDFRVGKFITTEDWQIDLKKLSAEYVQDKHNEWFCLLGQSGAGKTHICSAIAKTFLDRGIETKYVVWNTFIRELKSDNLEDKIMMYKFRKVPVLYIDDFLKGKYTEVDITLAFDLLNYRYNNKLTTIITSELEFNKLMMIDGAIAGRIKERCGKYFMEIKKDVNRNYRLKNN